MKLSRRGAWSPAARGQSMVEFALVLPIFMTLVLGILDLGRVVFIKSMLENAVREGVRVGAITEPPFAANVTERITTQPLLSGANVTVTCRPASCAYGSTVEVSATLQANLVAGGFLGLADPMLTAAAAGRIE